MITGFVRGSSVSVWKQCFQAPCCDHTCRADNRSDPQFDLYGAEDRLGCNVARLLLTKDAKIVCDFFDIVHTSFHNLTTVGGTSIWAGDGVLSHDCDCPEMEFLDINLTKDSSLLLHSITVSSTGGF